MSQLPKIQDFKTNPIWIATWLIIENISYSTELTEQQKITLENAFPVIKQMLVPATKKECLVIYMRVFCGANPGWVPHAEKGFPGAKNEWLDAFSMYPYWVNLIVYKKFINTESYASLPKYHKWAKELNLYQNIKRAFNVINNKLHCK